jgi:AbrB family looped-hinge helix DNA binding protein
MKVRDFVKTSPRGQIVIPKRMRDALSIDENTQLQIVLKDDRIFIEPVEEILPKRTKYLSYLDILEKTKGTWKDNDWDKTARKRRRIELEASRRRKTW